MGSHRIGEGNVCTWNTLLVREFGVWKLHWSFLRAEIAQLHIACHWIYPDKKRWLLQIPSIDIGGLSYCRVCWKLRYEYVGRSKTWETSDTGISRLVETRHEIKCGVDFWKSFRISWALPLIAEQYPSTLQRMAIESAGYSTNVVTMIRLPIDQITSLSQQLHFFFRLSSTGMFN